MVMTKVKNKHDFLYQLTSERINMGRTVWANGQSYVQNLKTPDVHILYIITQFITVSFNDKMMQLHFKTTKHFKNSEPLTCKVLEENKQTNNKKQQNEPNQPTTINVLFQILCPKNQVIAKKLHTSQKRGKEQKS